MKTLFVWLVALLFAFFLGCQNSITDPVVTDNSEYIGTSEEEIAFKDAVSAFPGLIKLDGNLFDPLHPAYAVQIDGIIRYKLELLNQEALKVIIYINASLKSGCPGQNKHWMVYGLTEDVLHSTTGILEKSFDVKNTCNCHFKLVLRLKVNEKEVILISAELKPYGGCYANRDFF
jgi:hypothetical protein